VGSLISPICEYIIWPCVETVYQQSGYQMMHRFGLNLRPDRFDDRRAATIGTHHQTGPHDAVLSLMLEADRGRQSGFHRDVGHASQERRTSGLCRAVQRVAQTGMPKGHHAFDAGYHRREVDRVRSRQFDRNARIKPRQLCIVVTAGCKQIVQNAQLRSLVETPRHDGFAPDAVYVNQRPFEDQHTKAIAGEAGAESTSSHTGADNHNVELRHGRSLPSPKGV
jgi:hypothetical protein